MTVLFTDLVDSTALIGRYGPEAADSLRRAHDAAVRLALDAHGGRRVKHTGDGIMAVFDSAVEAVSAARALQVAVLRARQRDQRTPEVRIGISTGEAVTEDGDLFGQSVIEAARLCAEAVPGQILASHVVALLVGSRRGHTFIAVGERRLKGFNKPIGVVEVPWVPDAASPLQLPGAVATAHRGPLVGRDDVLEALRTSWKSASIGERRVMLISGQPGIGKTRVAAALAAEVHDQGGMVLWGRCDEEVVVAHQPFVEALRHLVTGLPADELSGLEPRGDLARLVPELAGLVREPPDPVTGDPDVERLHLFEAVGHLLRAASELAPILIVLDDVQWAAKPTLLLLRHLASDPAPAAVLIVATYQDTDLDRTHPLSDVLADLRRRPDVFRLTLTGLDSQAVADLVELTAGEHLDASGRELVGMVHAETDGNPFFIGQVLRHLAETGAVVLEGRRWIARRPFDAGSVPQGVREVVGRRLARRSGRANRVLAVAAVVGRAFELRVVERVPDAGGAEEVLDGLDEAVAARLVDEDPSTPGRYTFVHALVRQTLLAELTSARRARLHRRIGEALEQLPGADPALVAHHFCAGATAGGIGAAVHWSVLAVEAAIDDLAWEQAQALAERALEVLELDDPRSAATAGRRARLRMGLARALMAQRDIEASKAQYLLAAQEARLAGDAPGFAEAAIGRIGWAEAATPDPEGAAVVEQALDLLSPDDLARRAMVQGRLAFYRRVSEGRGVDAEVLAREAASVARRSGDPEAIRMALLDLSFILLAGPDTAAQRAVLEELAAGRAARPRQREAVFEFVNDPYAVAHRMILSLQLGDRDVAEATFAEFAAVPTAVGSQRRALVAMWTAMLALMDGDLTAAEAANGRLLELAGADVNFVNSWAAQLVYLRWEQARLDEVLPVLREASRDRPGLVALEALLASMLAERGDLDEARDVLRGLAANRAARVPRDMLWSAALAALTTVCARVRDRDAAVVLHEGLSAFEGQLLQVAWGVVSPGAADRYLAMLDTVLDRHADADRHFDAAVELEQRARAPALVARTRLWWARSLLDRDEPSASQRAEEQLKTCVTAARRLGLIAITEEAEALLAQHS